MTGDRFDAAVLGAGAAGLVAAIRAAERGRSVVLLEKNRRPGVKILRKSVRYGANAAVWRQK